MTTMATESNLKSVEYRAIPDLPLSPDSINDSEFHVENKAIPGMSKPQVDGSNCISGLLTASVIESDFDKNFLKSVEEKGNLIDLNKICL